MITTLYANETQGTHPPSWYVASAPAFRFPFFMKNQLFNFVLYQ